MLGIRVASSPADGRGHIARCEAIRACIEGPVTWFADAGHSLDSVKDTILIEPETDSIETLQTAVTAGQITSVLLDSYHLKPDAVEVLSRSVLCAALSDFSPYPDVHTVVVPQALAPFQAGRNRVYGGLDYQVVPAALNSFRGQTGSGVGDALRILVSFGARDSANRTGLTLSALALLSNRRDISVTCVLGRDAPHCDEIHRRVADHPTTSFLVDVDQMGPLYADHDLAIGAPGVSQTERAYCGLPTLLLPQNDAQVPLCQAWADLGAAALAIPESKSIAAAVDLLLRDKPFRNAVRSKAMGLIDGSGAERIAGLIQEMME